jgi:hypothetical protein
MVSIRPRHLAIVFTLYFAIVAYLAYGAARVSTEAWFPPALSLSIYQTTMIGGVLILAGLFIAASILPHASRVRTARSESEASAVGNGTGPSLSGGRLSRSSPAQAAADRWAVEDFLDDPELEPLAYPSSSRAQDAAAVSAALSRMRPGASASTAGTFMDRLSGLRVHDSPMTVSHDQELTARLVRVASEMRPLLVAAKRAGLDVLGIRRIVSDATVPRGGDLAYRLRILERIKVTLERALSQRVSRELENLLRDIEGSQMFMEDVQGAELTAAEAVALLDTGHYADAFERAHKARELFEQQMSPTLPPAQSGPAQNAFVAFAGPSLYAAVYVAIAAMLLPGVAGFLQSNFALNTGVILFLSYGWFALVMYAFLSIVVASRHESQPVPSKGLFDNRF